jgi:hypothetical protein
VDAGLITVPTEAIGLRLIELGSIVVNGRSVIFTRSNKPALPEHIAMVQRAYQDPVVREQEEQRRADLATQIGISRCSFAGLASEKYLSNGKTRGVGLCHLTITAAP